MKNFVVGLTLLLALCVRGWGQSEWSGVWTTNTSATALESNMIAVPAPVVHSTARPSLAGGSVELPESLPMGSVSNVLNHIVSVRIGLMYAHLSLAYRDQDGNFHQYTVSKSTYTGYADFSEFLTDIAGASVDLIDSTRKKGAGESKLTVSLSYSYLNEVTGSDLIGLLRIRDAGTISTLTPNIVTNTLFGTSLERDTLQAVVPVPNLKRFRVDIQTVLGPAFYEWSESGIQKANWTRANKTVAGYVVISGWFALGQYVARITFEAGSDSAIYTQFGERLVPPMLTLSGNQLVIEAPRGADVTVEGTKDLVTWKQVSKILSADSKTTIYTPTTEDCYIFRASVW